MSCHTTVRLIVFVSQMCDCRKRKVAFSKRSLNEHTLFDLHTYTMCITHYRIRGMINKSSEISSFSCVKLTFLLSKTNKTTHELWLIFINFAWKWILVDPVDYPELLSKSRKTKTSRSSLGSIYPNYFLNVLLEWPIQAMKSHLHRF